MTAKELYSKCVEELSFTENASFEALCLFKTLLNIDKTSLITKDILVADKDIETINDALNRRQNFEPLQYILGSWDFYDMTFYVGEGVLIPRPETEMLVDFALEKINSVESPIIFDLCAGTGCIGLTIANHRKDAKVYLFEKDDKAFKYLKYNKERYSLDNVELIQCDISNFDVGKLPKCDVLLSNPPYIKTDEIESLQDEVHFEPVIALDGGADGLEFYKVINNIWLSKIKEDGYLALECGENQSNCICDIFRENVREIKVIFDFNNIDRIVTFRI